MKGLSLPVSRNFFQEGLCYMELVELLPFLFAFWRMLVAAINHNTHIN